MDLGLLGTLPTAATAGLDGRSNLRVKRQERPQLFAVLLSFELAVLLFLMWAIMQYPAFWEIWAVQRLVRALAPN